MVETIAATRDVIARWLTPSAATGDVRDRSDDSANELANTADLLRIGVQWGERPHIQAGSKVVTFSGIVRAADRIATTLAGNGIERGDRVFVHGRNSAEWVSAVWGVWRASAVPVLGNPSWTEEEVAHALTATSSKAVLVDAALSQKIPSGVKLWAMADAECADERLVEEWSTILDSRAREVRITDPAAVVFTSGTTEFAKAALLTHRTFAVNLQGFLALTKKARRVVDAEPGPPALVSTPLFHVGGIHGVVRSLVEGGKRIFLSGRFDAGEILRIIEEEKVRSVLLVPTALKRLLAHPDFPKRDLSSLRSTTVGAAPVPASMLEELREKIPSLKVGVNTGYGLTETGGAVTAASPADIAARPGTVGRALPWMEIRIDNPDAEGYGEIAVRSSAQMLGYLTVQGLIEKPSDTGGWVMTGDIGRLDEDGYLWVNGRSKDVIIRGGENISAARVEAVLHGHPAVIEVGVIGLPDPEWGEIVGAVVRVGSDVDSAELTAHASEHLARFEIPAHWRLVRDPLPTNDMGKILKRELVHYFQADSGVESGQSHV